MKTKVAAKNPSSYKDLCEAKKEVWTREITQDFCASLVSSMPRRIKAVIDACGRTNRYLDVSQSNHDLLIFMLSMLCLIGVELDMHLIRVYMDFIVLQAISQTVLQRVNEAGVDKF